MAKKSKLTKAELKREEEFAALRAELEGQGYVCHEKLYGAVYANVMSIVVMLPYAAVMAALYWVFNGQNMFVAQNAGGEGFSFWKTELFLLLLIAAFFVCAFIHELIHGICFAAFAKKKWKAVSFGFNTRVFAPYCTSNEPLTKKQYIIAAVMPTLWLGFLLGGVAIFLGNAFLMMVSICMLFGGGMDFLMIYNLLRLKTAGKDVLFFDHPTAIGSYYFVR